MTKTQLVSRILQELQDLRCPEPHNTGLGSCHCRVNDAIDDIEELIIRLEDESNGSN